MQMNDFVVNIPRFGKGEGNYAVPPLLPVGNGRSHVVIHFQPLRAVSLPGSFDERRLPNRTDLWIAITITIKNVSLIIGESGSRTFLHCFAATRSNSPEAPSNPGKHVHNYYYAILYDISSNKLLLYFTPLRIIAPISWFSFRSNRSVAIENISPLIKTFVIA